MCINTGGEKVFPEEVEEALKTHPAVRDAVVVGVPDEQFGEAITAVVEPDRRRPVDEAERHRPREADRWPPTRRPKRVVTIDTIGRAPNGKVDYKALRAYAESHLRV